MPTHGYWPVLQSKIRFLAGKWSTQPSGEFPCLPQVCSLRHGSGGSSWKELFASNMPQREWQGCVAKQDWFQSTATVSCKHAVCLSTCALSSCSGLQPCLRAPESFRQVRSRQSNRMPLRTAPDVASCVQAIRRALTYRNICPQQVYFKFG